MPSSLALRIVLPWNVDVGEQIQVVLARGDLLQDLFVTIAELELAPNLDHIKIGIAYQQPVGIPRELVFDAQLTMSNRCKIALNIGPDEFIHIPAGIFRHPFRFEVGSQVG